MADGLCKGDWVRVKDGHDIPAVFRGGKPTEGRVDWIDLVDDVVIVLIPIGGADVDEHSQSVPYPTDALEVISHG